MAVYKGRGLVKLDAVEVGNVPALTLRMQSTELLRYIATLADPIPTLEHVTQLPSRIEISMIIPEYLGANLRVLTGGGGAAGIAEIAADLDQEYAITFDGVNCITETDFDFVGYKFVPLVSTDIGIIEEGMAAAELHGILLADATKTGAGISQYGKFTVA